MARALVVDDEPFVTLLAGDELELAGFEIERAADAREAIAMLERDRAWDLLMTDIRMPGTIDGWELGRVARELVPELRIIYASGYEAPPTLAGHEQFIEKPYEVADLDAALSQLGFRR